MSSAKDNEKEPDKGGRPRIELDEEQLLKLDRNAARFWTDEEIAYDLGISSDTLTRRFAEPIKKGKSKGKASLRSMQFQVAMGRPGAPAVYLRERQDERGNQAGDLVRDADGKPIKIREEQPGEKPNVTMLIWLGKQHLGQSDKVDFPDDGPDGFAFTEPPPKPPEPKPSKKEVKKK